MIKAEGIGSPTEHVLKRSANMRAKLLFQILEGERVTEIEVESDEAGKPPNVVTFYELPDGIHITCFKKETEMSPQRNCEANAYHRYCSHVACAIKLLLDSD